MTGALSGPRWGGLGHPPGQWAGHGLAAAAVQAVGLPDAPVHLEQQLLPRQDLVKSAFMELRMLEQHLVEGADLQADLGVFHALLIQAGDAGLTGVFKGESARGSGRGPAGVRERERFKA